MKTRQPIALNAPVIPTSLTTFLVDEINRLQSSVKTDYLKETFLSKYVSNETDPAPIRRQRAIEKWLWTEVDNEATNERILNTHGDFNILPRVAFGGFVDWCRDFIRDTIGETPPVEALLGAFSGGASTSRQRTSSQPGSKYLGIAHTTERCLGIFSSLEDEMPGWPIGKGVISPEVVPGNVLFTVPKKTEIDRVACKEPDLNMFIQKGIGNYFRRCLRRTGINLNDQSINRSLAHRGSVTGSLATLDLSSASDSVTEGLCALFLPEIWYTHLDAVRCHVTVIDGEEHRNQMFSSMGNGFTFELESLLFFTIAKAVAFFTGTRGVISVYGDDIICPVQLCENLEWVLRWFGFTVNSEKSCVEGPFRESCGGHYWNGLDVTPFYIRAPIESLVDVIDVANKLRQWASVDGCSILDPEVESIWLHLKHLVPQCLWGGEDTSFKYRLVSYDIGTHRLSEKRKRVSAGLGGYYHWLNATWDRDFSSDGIETSSFTVTRPSDLSLKKVRKPTVPQLPAVFLSEIGRF